MRNSALTFAAALDGLTSMERDSLAIRMFGLPETPPYAESWWRSPGIDRPADLLAFFHSSSRAVQVVLCERGWPPDWKVTGIAVPAAP